MRKSALALGILLCGTVAGSAQADPYRWCAVYGGGQGGGSENCYFMTLDQCRATVSGVGGFCRPNNYYTGPQYERRGDRRSKRRVYEDDYDD